MTTTLTKPRTASIIVDTEGDGFKIQHMLFIGDELMDEAAEDWDTAGVATYVTKVLIRNSGRPTSVFITISAAKRMTDEQIAAIQAAALQTRSESGNVYRF